MNELNSRDGMLDYHFSNHHIIMVQVFSRGRSILCTHLGNSAGFQGLPIYGNSKGDEGNEQWFSVFQAFAQKGQATKMKLYLSSS
jgi:hypothetical protein